MNPKQIEALEADQARDLRAIEDAVTKAQQKLAAINREHLKADVVQEQERAIREGTANELAARRNAMLERAERAKAGQHLVSREALLRRARFDEDAAVDATIRSARFMTLSKTPTVALLSYLEDAIAAGDVAGAETVRMPWRQGPRTQQAIRCTVRQTA